MAFQRACGVDQIREGEAFAVNLDGVDVAVARHEDEFFAVQDLCTHGQVALSEGDVEGCLIECWLHGSRFDLRSGKPTTLPATEPVATFPVQVQGDDIHVDVKSTLNGVTPA